MGGSRGKTEVWRLGLSSKIDKFLGKASGDPQVHEEAY